MDKIDRLIEEAGIITRIKNLLQKINPLPKNVLQRIRQKYRSRLTNIEEAKITAAPKIEGETDNRDTCYTSIMKLIGKERLIKKYPHLSDFLEAYEEKGGPFVETQKNKMSFEDLKPGTIIFLEYKDPAVSTVNRSFGKFGIRQKTEVYPGHLMIYVGKDPSKKKEPYMVLHNGGVQDDRMVGGSGLELQLEAMNNKWIVKKHKYYTIMLLDYKTIDKL